MLTLRLILAVPLLCIILPGLALSMFFSLILGSLLAIAGISLAIGLILRIIPQMGDSVSEPFFAFRRFLELIMGIGIFVFGLILILTVFIPGEFLFKGKCTIWEVISKEIEEGNFDVKQFLSSIFSFLEKNGDS